MNFMRKPVAAQARSRHQTKVFSAPTKGWVSAVNMSSNLQQACLRLENWFPTTTGIRLGGTSTLFATIGVNPVEFMFTYVDGGTKKIFASDETNVFDITSVANPEVAPAASITGQTSGYYSSVPFTTSGGAYLTILNGDDDPQLFDGTTWQAITAVSTPAITGVTTSSLTQGWVYRNREYFVEGGSQSAWYLPVDSIGGAASEIALSGVFKHGGNLLFGSTWSLDAGDGVDDKCVFISSTGEVAVYEGSYPGGSDWRIVGRYDMPEPLGKNASMQIGGDLLIVTEAGIIPISAVITKDPAALSISAISQNIEPDWRKAVIARRSLPWGIVKWAAKNMTLVTTPVTSTSDVDMCFVANSITGAWCKYLWNTRCAVIHDDWLHFGTNSGTIHKGDVGSDNSGALVYHTYIGHAENMGSSNIKQVFQAKAYFTTSVEFDPQLSISTDYTIALPSAPNAMATGDANEWDVGLWDVAKWDAGDELYSTNTLWVSIGKSGYTIMPQIQVTSGSSKTPNAELVSFALTYEEGHVVV